MNDDTENLSTKVSQWLVGQGYPLEMNVARELQSSNYSVSLSDYYLDFDTNESREIDVSALKWSDFNKPVFIQFCLRVECKLITDKPWVVFLSDSQIHLPFPYNEIYSDIFKTFLFENQLTGDWFDQFQSIKLFHPPKIGYGLTQAFSNGVDNSYKALMSVVKSSIARAIEFDKFPYHLMKNYACVIAKPIIVVDGRLFEAFLDEENNTHINEVEHSLLHWKGINPKQSSPLVPIVTKNSLDYLIKEMDNLSELYFSFAEAYMSELEELANSIVSRQTSATNVG